MTRTKALHNASQAQVDTRCHKGRANGQATYLQQEGVILELIVLAPRTASVTKYLTETTKHHGEGEVPGSSFGEPGDHVGHQHDDEQGGEGHVGLKIEDVAVETRLTYTIGRVGMFDAELRDLVHGVGIEPVLGQFCGFEGEAGERGHAMQAACGCVHGGLNLDVQTGYNIL